MSNVARLVEHVKQARTRADAGTSKLSSAVLNMNGMSGAKTRHLLNNLCALPGTRFLEVGSWKGSTLVSALYGNEVDSAVAMDNWSQYGGPQAQKDFWANVTRHVPTAPLRFIEQDCFTAELGDEKYNIYLYDGPHEYDDHKNAVTYFYKNLDFPCVLLIDDWNWRDVRRGTYDGLVQVGAKVAYADHVRLTYDDSHTGLDEAHDSYWNGMGIFVLQDEY